MTVTTDNWKVTVTERRLEFASIKGNGVEFFFFYQQNQLQDYADERYQLNLLKQNLCTSLV